MKNISVKYRANICAVGLANLRLSAHQLRIETGRYGRNRVPIDERYCTICDARDIEDEYHFVIVCPRYNELRTRYIPAYYRRRCSMHKFVNLLNTPNKSHLRKLALFVYHATELRSLTVNN